MAHRAVATGSRSQRQLQNCSPAATGELSEQLQQELANGRSLYLAAKASRLYAPTLNMRVEARLLRCSSPLKGLWFETSFR